MSNFTNIEWTDATWNTVVGCSKVSAGCANCYAEKMANRIKSRNVLDSICGAYRSVVGADRKWNGRIETYDNALTIPLRWKKPRHIFVNSMSDLFHEQVPFDFIDKVFAVMAKCQQHTFQILTKRPDQMAKYLRRIMRDCGTILHAAHKLGIEPPEPKTATKRDYLHYCWPFQNVWIGTSVENQQTADSRIPHLLDCPATMRFLSCEPLLGSIDIHFVSPVKTRDLKNQSLADERREIDLVIVGGESGTHARPCKIEWIRSIMRQCRGANVPVFVKQLGANPMFGFGNELLLKDRKGGNPEEWPEDLRVREMPL